MKKNDKVFLVICEIVWDGEPDGAEIWAYANEDDAKDKVLSLANEVRPDWVNECVNEDEYQFHAWRDGESSYYHCDIYIDEKEVL